MGEYAKLKGTGAEIKIGTCENMYYLRYDQRDQVWPQAHSLNPSDRETQRSIRFRFPWPDEDANAPGDFDDPFRRLAVHVPAPEGVDHSSVQFTSNSPKGYLVSLPCPEGPSESAAFTLDDDGIKTVKIHRNGFVGATFLWQQRVWEDRLVAVLQCACGASYRLPEITDAQPVYDDLMAQAEQIRGWSAGWRHDGAVLDGDEARAVWLETVAARMMAGYTADADRAVTGWVRPDGTRADGRPQ